MHPFTFTPAHFHFKIKPICLLLNQMFGQNNCLFDLKNKLICLKTETSAYKDSKMVYSACWFKWKIKSEISIFVSELLWSVNNIFRANFCTICSKKVLVLIPDCLSCLDLCSKTASTTILDLQQPQLFRIKCTM